MILLKKASAFCLAVLLTTSASTFLLANDAQAQAPELEQEFIEDLSVPDRFLKVTPDIYRGGRPSATDLATLQSDYGIKTVVSLESNEEEVEKEKATAKRLGLKFISVPMSGFRVPTNEDVDRVLVQLINARKNGNVYLHCHYGRDRTGLLVGLYRVFYQDWTRKEAYAEMKAKGFRSALIALKSYFNYRTSGYP